LLEKWTFCLSYILYPLIQFIVFSFTQFSHQVIPWTCSQLPTFASPGNLSPLFPLSCSSTFLTSFWPTTHSCYNIKQQGNNTSYSSLFLLFNKRPCTYILHWAPQVVSHPAYLISVLSIPFLFWYILLLISLV
jgi:hypothetical protein